MQEGDWHENRKRPVLFKCFSQKEMHTSSFYPGDTSDGNERKLVETLKIKSTFRLRSVGKKAFNGLSSSYDETFPMELEGVISQQEWKYIMEQINDGLIMRWPCLPCEWISWILLPFTLGVSLLLAHAQIRSALKGLKSQLKYINQRKAFKEANVILVYEQRCCKSWIQGYHFAEPPPADSHRSSTDTEDRNSRLISVNMSSTISVA
mmetsp:Transcript_30253/g.39907  ORF Transcript_30253/g.39907 Transcript_30253/m.39907 type:complete len:207 (+) Transcript_30253:97-717(+)